MNDRLRQVPLNTLLALIVLTLIAVAVGFGLANYFIYEASLTRIERIQTAIQEADESINEGRVVETSSHTNGAIEKAYYENGELLATDVLVLDEDDSRYRLVVRRYYLDKQVLAEDTFYLAAPDQDIEKSRQYYNSRGVAFLYEDFGKGGILVQKRYLSRDGDELIQSSMRSPLPPPAMLYYR